MNNEHSRIDAVRLLLDDETGRKEKARWEALFTDVSLSPLFEDPKLEQDFYDLMIVEMEEGYLRNDILKREKRKKAGRSGSYIPPQMRVSPDIGRFIFACFNWHGFHTTQTTAKVEEKGLNDIAEAFGFKVDPLENERQFMDKEVRETIIEKEKGFEYNLRLWAMIIGGLFISFSMVISYMS